MLLYKGQVTTTQRADEELHRAHSGIASTVCNRLIGDNRVFAVRDVEPRTTAKCDPHGHGFHRSYKPKHVFEPSSRIRPLTALRTLLFFQEKGRPGMGHIRHDFDARVADFRQAAHGFGK